MKTKVTSTSTSKTSAVKDDLAITKSSSKTERKQSEKCICEILHVDVIVVNIVQVLLQHQLEFQPQVELLHHNLPQLFRDQWNINPPFPALQFKQVKKNMSQAQ